MVKEKIRKIPKWLKRTIGVLAVLLVVAVGVIIFFNSATASSRTQAEPDTTALAKGDITKTISVSGVVESNSVSNVYSTQTAYPVKEIYVDVGDSVKKGDVIAVLDMSKLENDIAQAEINYESAVLSADQELVNNGNSVTNAETSLESTSIALSRQQQSTSNASSDLKDAQDKVGDFDSYSYDKAISDALVTLERKTTDMQDAEADYHEAIYYFDDYTYQNTIRDALTTLQRKQDDLATAQDDLDEAKRGSTDEFDDYSYQSAITTAKNNISKAEDALSSARQELRNAENNLTNAGDDVTDTKWTSLQTAVTTAEKTVSTCETSLDDAYTALDKARDDLSHAEEQFETNTADADEAAVEAAQKAYDSAKNQFDDAQRTYDKALSDLQRAKNDAAENSYDKLVIAQNALEDAQRSYEKALNDKIKASDDYDDSIKTQIENAQKTLSDSRKQLESSQNSLKSAENSLTQAEEKIASQGSSVELQKLNIEKLNTQLSEGTIYATADGVITEKNAKIGANPSGVLFVIEDIDDLYVSANVKEYNLSQIASGQQALVTADATGDSIYDATVTYISPKAVSAAGSTSVEFEIRADLIMPDRDIKIGMNAYLNVITDTRENVFTVSLSSLSYEAGQAYVYAYENGETIKYPVTVGLKTSSVAEILGIDLYEGMILLSDPDSYFAGPTQAATGFVMTAG